MSANGIIAVTKAFAVALGFKGTQENIAEVLKYHAIFQPTSR